MNNVIVEEAKLMISKGKINCAVIKNGEIIAVETSRGIVPILSLYERGLLKESFVVDKIIGKAAALMLILGESCGCYGEIMSQSAVEIFEENSFDFSYGQLCSAIINRKGDDICPMEKTVAKISEPKQAYEMLLKKLQNLSKHE